MNLMNVKYSMKVHLTQLYNQDFEKFIDYNRQDTLLLNKLDKKLRFIDPSNALAHENTVLLMTTMGAVAVTEQAIINDAHARGMVVSNRQNRDGQPNYGGRCLCGISQERFT